MSKAHLKFIVNYGCVGLSIRFDFSSTNLYNVGSTNTDSIACTNLDLSNTDVLGDEVRREYHVCYDVGFEDEILLDHSSIGAVNVLDRVAVGHDRRLNASNGL